MTRSRNAIAICLVMLIQYILFLQNASAQDLNKRFSIKADNTKQSYLFKEIYKQTSFIISSQLDKKTTYSFDFHDVLMSYVLDSIFGKGRYTMDVKNGNTLLINKLKISTTTKSSNKADTTREYDFRGQVVNITGKPLAGASVRFKNSKTGKQTDSLGRFLFKADLKKIQLVVSFMGYEPQQLECVTGRYNLFRLDSAINKLDERTVVAYSVTSPRYSTGNTSIIRSEQIRRNAGENLASVLQGRLPGLTVTQPNGLPGASFNLTVRGRASLLGNSDPLIIIDGVQLSSQYLNQYSSIISKNTSAGMNIWSLLDPNQIESISLYRDAASTAIYGSRGANGVLDIKTKKGVSGDLILTGSFSKEFSTVSNKLKLLNTSEYIALRKEAYKNDGIEPGTPSGTPDDVPDLLDSTRYTDWQKVLLGEVACIKMGSLSLAGGTEKARFYLGTSVRDESSILSKDMGYTRYGINGSFQSTSKNNRFHTSFNGYFSGVNNTMYDGSLKAIFLQPNAPALYNNNGGINFDDWKGRGENPLIAIQRKYNVKLNTIIASGNIKYDVSKHFSFKTNLGYNSIRANESLIMPKSSFDPSAPADSAAGTTSFGKNSINSYIAEPIITYHKDDLKALIGGTYQYSDNTILSRVGDGFPDDQSLGNPEAASHFADSVRTRNFYKYAALFGQLDYRYKDKYLLNVTYRVDGSSRFSPDNRVGHFGAIGMGWIFSEEKFMSRLKGIFEYAKIRLSYGVTGNDQIGDYQYVETWQHTGNGTFEGLRPQTPTRLYNPTYSWEQNRKAELALEYQLLKGRLSGNLAFFLNRSSKQLINQKLPDQSGFPTILINSDAEIQNSGVEFLTDISVVKTPSFNMDLSMNITIPRNVLRSFDGITSSGLDDKLRIGKSISGLNLFQWDGIDPETGDQILRNINKDRLIDNRDRLPVYNLDPEYYGGLALQMRYKKLAFGFVTEFKKTKVPSDVYGTIMGELRLGFPTNQLATTNNHWRKPGDHVDYPKPSADFYGSVYSNLYQVAESTRAYTDGSYLKLRNVYFEYLFDNFRSLKYVEGIRLSLKGQNLFTLTKYKSGDPETANLFVAPPLRTISLGVEVKFKVHSKNKR